MERGQPAHRPSHQRADVAADRHLAPVQRGYRADQEHEHPDHRFCGMLETYSEIDKALADLNGNTAAYRLSEDRAFLEG